MLEAFPGFTSKPLQVQDSNLIGPRYDCAISYGP